MPQTDLRGIVTRMVDAGESEANIAAVIQRFSKPPQPRSLLSPSTPEDFPVVNAARGVVNAIKKIPAGIYSTVTDPIGTVQGIGEAQGRVGVGAKDAFDKGDYLTAARKSINYVLPVVGPMMDAASDRMAAGENVAEVSGELATDATLLALGGRPRPAAVVKPPRMAGPTNPVEAAAVEFARQKGVPLDLGTATGRQLIKNTQKRVGNTIAGEAPALAMQDAQASNLARVGQELADQAGPRTTNPVAAGEGVRASLTKQIENLHQTASTAYDTLRQIENQKPAKPAPANAMTALDVAQRTPLAVDLTAAVKQLQPLYTKLKREAELGIPMHGAKGRTLAALDGLMNAPNWAPLSVVDAALSDLKALARGADMPELRTSGQATAAQAVQALDAQVRATAAKAGPNVLKALEEGRAATKQKYVVADVLDMLSGEPGQVFKRLTQSKDVGVGLLRAVQQLAPKEMANVGRAFLEDLMEQARSKGGFEHADKLWADWQKLGGETKSRLFPKKGQIADLDNFFLLAKKMKENPNPSGTAQVLGSPRWTFMEALSYLPAKAVAKILFSPEAVKYLTTAQRASTGSSKASKALALTQVSKAAQSAGVSLDGIPAFAEDDQPSTPSGTRK